MVVLCTISKPQIAIIQAPYHNLPCKRLVSIRVSVAKLPAHRVNLSLGEVVSLSLEADQQLSVGLEGSIKTYRAFKWVVPYVCCT